jgi:hypothetical protein
MRAAFCLSNASHSHPSTRHFPHGAWSYSGWPHAQIILASVRRGSRTHWRVVRRMAAETHLVAHRDHGWSGGAPRVLDSSLTSFPQREELLALEEGIDANVARRMPVDEEPTRAALHHLQDTPEPSRPIAEFDEIADLEARHWDPPSKNPQSDREDTAERRDESPGVCAQP